MSDCDVNSPIDLSRRSDCDETHKTPSPYSSSSFTETSPSLGNDSPSSLNFRKNSLIRSNTPTNRYHPSAFKRINKKKQERITPSPPDFFQVHRQYQSLLQDSDDPERTLYYLNALHAQRIQLNGQMESGPSSPETEASILLPYSPELSSQDKKSTRPYKMYSNDSHGLTAAIPSSMDQFNLFRQQALNKLYASGELAIPKKRTMSQKSYDGSEQSEMDYHGENKSDSSSSNGKGMVKDEAYYERRRKNNVAAKKSRDRRRLKESELVIRAAFLQRENYQLRCELDAVKRQLERFIAV